MGANLLSMVKFMYSRSRTRRARGVVEAEMRQKQNRESRVESSEETRAEQRPEQKKDENRPEKKAERAERRQRRDAECWQRREQSPGRDENRVSAETRRV